MHTLTRLLWGLLLAMSVASSAQAKVARMSLDELIKDAGFVGIVTVNRVSKPLFGKRNAVATVVETWQGTPLQRVHFLAEPTWTCDISTAAPGERLLLFLVRPEGGRLLHIAHSGRGRMPLREFHRQTYATVWSDVQLPRDVANDSRTGPTVLMDRFRGT
jgi:hypothetical protein